MPRYRLIVAARLSKKLPKKDRTKARDTGLGIETQDSECVRWAEREGHDVVKVVADTRSGTVAPWDRPNLRKWVSCGCDWCQEQDRKRGLKRPKYEPERMTEYDGILAWRNDRLSRGAWDDEVKIREWAKVHNKVLIIKDGPQWPPRNKGDKWAWETMADQARTEWEDIQRRILVALAELKARGKFVGTVPFGYDSVGDKYDKRLVPNEWGLNYIPEIYGRVIKGISLADIAQWLADEGVPTTQANTIWWPRVVHRTVRNTTYTGFHYMDYTDPDTGKMLRGVHRCEALIDGGIFRQANEALVQREKRGAANADGDAMLKGVITCPDCENSPMYRHRCLNNHRGRTVFWYYRCAGRGPRRKSCGNMARMELVDSAVDEIIRETFDMPVFRKVVVPGHDHSVELEAVKHEIRQLAQLDLPDDEYDRKLRELRAERDRIDKLPVVPDTIELVDTGERYTEQWAALKPHERGLWLQAHDFTVTASKEAVTVIQGDIEVVRPLPAPMPVLAA